jgi:sugar phosphate isomerase/epimerase
VKLVYAKANWETPQLPLPTFLERAARDGFDAVEIHLPARPESPAEIRRLCAGAGLRLIAQIATAGLAPEDHARSLETLYARAAETTPLLVNCRTGRDVFEFDDNVRLFAHAQDLAASAGVPLLHETHRGRALFSAPATAAYLRVIPALRLTADLAHWFCVHESDLSDQPEAVSAALAAAHHVHARVGFDQGPQVGDPRGEAFAPWLARHLDLWRRIVSARKAEGLPLLTITPGFGPPPYMPLRPIDDEPVADAWAVNVWMRDRLTLEFGREA